MGVDTLSWEGVSISLYSLENTFPKYTYYILDFLKIQTAILRHYLLIAMQFNLKLGFYEAFQMILMFGKMWETLAQGIP